MHGSMIRVFTLSTAVLLQNALACAQADRPTPHWIWEGSESYADQTIYFRKTFDIKKSIVSEAILFAGCDDEMEVYVNGELVAKDEGWSTPIVEDVSELIVHGTNVLAIRATNRDGRQAGLLARLEIEPLIEQRYDLVTDNTWRVSATSVDSWNEADFDDAGWKPATLSGKLGEPPREKLNEQTFAETAKFRLPQATSPKDIKAPAGFIVDLLYTVPKDRQSTVCVRPIWGALPCYATLDRGQPAAKDPSRAGTCRTRRGTRIAVGIRQPLRRGEFGWRLYEWFVPSS